MLTALPALGSCARQQVASSPSPVPVKSVSALPGRSVADIKADRAAFSRMNTDGIVQVYVKDGTPAEKVKAMAERIAAMPQMVAYHFFDKRAAESRFIALDGLRYYGARAEYSPP